MNILFISPYPPSLIRVRPYNFIKFLSQRGNQVTVLSAYSNANELDDAQKLSGLCHQVIPIHISKWRSMWNVLLALPSTNPLQAVYSWSPQLANFALSRWLSNDGNDGSYDVIHIEHLRGSKFGLFLQKKLGRLPIVWDSVDCISLLFQLASTRSKSFIGRWATRFDLNRTEKYEALLLEQFHQVCVTSKNDRDALEKLNPTKSVSVIPNGVDLDYFTPGAPEFRKKNTLVVSGKMSYHANISMVVWLVQDIMPLVWEKFPQAKLEIVGKDPSRELLEFGTNPLITVTGAVPEIRSYLQQASIALTPITYGVGIQNKVLEALACATPVISTSQAISALALQNGKNIIIADEPNAFAHEIVQLLKAPEKQYKIGGSGREYVEQYHNWYNITAQLEKLYLKATTDQNI